MKLIVIFQNYKPLLKCGAAPVDPLAAIGMPLGIVENQMARNAQAANVQMQIAAQREENQKDRDWNTQEAEKARQFQSSTLEKQQAYQTQERIAGNQQQLAMSKEMAAENAKYNSPVYQSEQLRQAGINPSVYFGNHSSFAGSSQGVSGGQGSAPSVPSSPSAGGSHGLSPVSFQPVDLQIPQMMQAYAELSRVASTANVDKATIKELLSRASKQDEEAKLTKFHQTEQQIANYILENTKDDRIKMAFLEMEEQRHKVLTAENETELTKAKIGVAASEAKLNDALADVKGEEKYALQFANKRLEESYNLTKREMESRIRMQNAKSTESLASADEKRESIINMQEMRKLSLKEVNAKIKELASSTNLNQAQRRYVNAMAAQSEIQAQIMKDHAEETFWKDFVIDCLSSGVEIVSMGANVKNAISRAQSSDAFKKLSESQQKKMEFEMQHFGDVVESQTFNVNSSKASKRQYTRKRPPKR